MHQRPAAVVKRSRKARFTTESVAAVAVLGVIGTGIAYVLNYQIISSKGAATASTVTYQLPVVAIVLGVLVLSENVTVLKLGVSRVAGQRRRLCCLVVLNPSLNRLHEIVYS